MKRLLPVLLCCVALLSCKDERKLTRIDIAEYSSETGWIVALDDRYDKWFRSYSAVVLDGTRGSDVEGYQAVMGHDGNFLMIVDGEIRIFDAATGMDAGRIVPQEGGRYVCMDMDTLSGMLYALDSVHSRIDCVSSSGRFGRFCAAGRGARLRQGCAYRRRDFAGAGLRIFWKRDLSGGSRRRSGVCAGYSRR